MGTLLKACKDCKQLFPATIEFFQPHKRVRSGMGPRCRSCYLADHAKSMEKWRQKHPERSKEYQKQWVEDNRERYQELDRNRYKRDAEKRKGWQKQYRQSHPEQVKISRAKSYQRPSIKARVKTDSMRRRDVEKNLPNSFTSLQWQACIKYFHHRCAVCERQQGFWHTLAADHWIPVSNPLCPGTIPSNIVPLCHGLNGCNNQKGNTDPYVWLCQKYDAKKARKIFKHIQDYLTRLMPNSHTDDPS